ncbi:ATP-binding response regulator [Ramlibacter sp. Leaf400]|uniref:ATP-binding response regulator n=1 Tax=Ramlibacter sp. Leaf400 TaxID=1736365 RepID=UPI0006FFF4CC|nr:response regulator [Ramlibacter sp. Leaf400]KQT07687.1 histidine kinase [Ramlibacter sp. Leaf400]
MNTPSDSQFPASQFSASQFFDGAESPSPTVNILIVDDEPRNLAVLETVLDDPGYRLVRATSGEEALLALMAEEFAVLVLDVRMPGMNGFEVAQLVKERRKTARIPIIFLTAYYNEDQHILEGYGTGAVDYLHKPVNPSVLRSKVAVFAELHRRGRALEAANRLLLGEVAERRRAETRLSELNESLDRRVMERTRDLEQSEARLLDAHRRKDEFLATLAHELRNPLAPVRNAVELLKRAPGDAKRVGWASELIDRQVRSLSRLIDDLMDVSRISRGRIELRREVIALNDVLADALEAIRPLAQESGHELAVLLPDRKLLVDADRTRLAQAFTNLLNNAIKYTDTGGRIELGVLVEKDQAVVTVRDTGIGIPPERLEDVFEMFSQVESAISRSRGGLGIGLSLTQRLVQMHGGHIKAQSEGTGRGSRFLVHLPLSKADLPVAAPVATAAPASATAALRIVVADDNVDAAETLAALLSEMGHEVREVNDGEAAVQAAAAFDPHLVLLDIGMPKLTGYEACAQIRRQPGGDRRLMVAVTGWGQPQDLQRSQDAGFDRHLVKPIDPQVLGPLVEEVAARVRPPRAQRS